VRQSLIVVAFPLALALVACSPKPPSNFIAVDPAKRSDTWALQRADIDCKAEVSSKNWAYRWRLRSRVDANYVSCMEQKGFVRTQTDGLLASGKA
jgi:hypothetical protein